MYNNEVNWCSAYHWTMQSIFPPKWSAYLLASSWRNLSNNVRVLINWFNELSNCSLLKLFDNWDAVVMTSSNEASHVFLVKQLLTKRGDREII